MSSRLSASNAHGVTLIEVLVALSMLGVLMLAIMPHLRSGRQVWEIVGDRHADTLQNARIAMDKMTREIRQSKDISDAGSDYIELVDRDDNSLKFQLNAQYLESGAPGSLDVLAGPADSLSFSYYGEDGVTPAVSPEDIRSVSIQLTTLDSEGKVDPIALSSRVLVRRDATNGDKTIVINEIMYNPFLSPDNNWEWIELYNCSDSDVDVDGWKFNNKEIKSLGSTVISAGGFATIAKWNSAVYWLLYLLPPDVAKLYVSGNMNMGNGGDTITIWSAADESVDSVTYDDSWGGDGNGRTLERIDPEGGSNDSDNWEEGSLSSPGEAN